MIMKPNNSVRRVAYGVMVVADVLVPNRHQATNIHHTGSLERWLRCYMNDILGLILGLGPPNDRRRYRVTPSLIGWAET